MSNSRVSTDFEDYLPLSTTRLSDGHRQLNRVYQLEIDDIRYKIKEGFVTDFSSYPWYARLIVRFSKVDIAGVIHDWLYCKGEISRAEADEIWRQVARAGESHANALQAWLSWVGLRIGGWISWNKYRRGHGRSDCD